MHIPVAWRRKSRRNQTNHSNHSNSQGAGRAYRLPRWQPLSKDKLRRLPDEASGWWLVLAEVLAVVVLVVLAAYTGGQAQRLSESITRAALADMVRSDPLEVCVTGDETLTGWVRTSGPLSLQAEIAWPNGTHVTSCYEPEFQNVSSPSIISSHNNITLAGHHSITLADELTLSAMFRCGLVAGLARSVDFGGTGESDLLGLRTRNVSLDLRNHLYHRVNLTDRNGSVLHGHLLKSLDEFIRLPAGYFTGSFQHGSFQVSSFFRGAGCCQSFVRLTYNGTHPEGWTYQFGTWLWLAQQAETMECMARHANVDVELALRRYRCEAHGELISPKAANMTVIGLFVRPMPFPARGPFSRPYACASGVDDASPNFASLQAKFAAYKARHKATLTTSLFGSMVDQNSDDVYAVYTGILGALFGAFALLVTTLLVFAMAALRRSFVCR